MLAAVVIGAGSSAIATILFTQAFVDGDPVTPVVLQKVQPIIAVIAARIILGERPRPRFVLYLVPALVGTWLIGVNHPLHPSAQGLKPMLFALGAASLWALGTVLGRYLSQRMKFQYVTTLRFAFGLPAAAIALLVLGAPAFPSGHDFGWIAVLALVTGLIALGLYYYGLQTTPAVAATIAELAFPVSATLVGYFKFGYVLTGWQWVGVALTTLVVALLPARSEKHRAGARPRRVDAVAGPRLVLRLLLLVGPGLGGEGAGDVEGREHADRQPCVVDDEQMACLVLGEQPRCMDERQLGRHRDNGRCGDRAGVRVGADRRHEVEVGDHAPGPEPVVAAEDDDRVHVMARHHARDAAQRGDWQAGQNSGVHRFADRAGFEFGKRDGHRCTSCLSRATPALTAAAATARATLGATLRSKTLGTM